MNPNDSKFTLGLSLEQVYVYSGEIKKMNKKEKQVLNLGHFCWETLRLYFVSIETETRYFRRNQNLQQGQLLKAEILILQKLT